MNAETSWICSVESTLSNAVMPFLQFVIESTHLG
jgi:hypothetical protein